MKKLILSAFVLISLCASAQKKDTAAAKSYTFNMDENQWHFVDSVLQRSYYYIGRSMDFETADILKQNLAAIIGFLTDQKNKKP